MLLLSNINKTKLCKKSSVQPEPAQKREETKAIVKQEARRQQTIALEKREESSSEEAVVDDEPRSKKQQSPRLGSPIRTFEERGLKRSGSMITDAQDDVRSTEYRSPKRIKK